MGWVIVILAIFGIAMWVSHSNNKERGRILSKYDFTPEQKEMFLNKKIWIGMPIEVLHSILGHGEERKTTTAGGEHIQHIFKYSDEYRYVYTDNGIVSSWQGK